MNVLFLTHSFPRRSGDAAGSFILRLASALAKEDVEVHVVAPSERDLPPAEVMDGVTVERFRYAPRRFEKLAYTGNMAQDVASSWRAKLALISFLGSDFVTAVRARRSFEPDVIHAHWWFPSGVIGTWLSRMSHRPLVTTLHGTDVRLTRSVAVSRPLFRHVMEHSDAVTTVSSWLAREVRKLVPATRPEVFPMPAATDSFSPRNGREKGRLLFVGRLTQQKGVDLLLRAFAQMRELAMLDIVGEGNARAELRNLARDLSLNGRVAWHGQLSQEQLAGLYRSASALVVPSTDEGLGLVAVEALLCETPVIGFRSGGLTDVIRDNSTGVLVEPGDVAALAIALDDVIVHPDRAAALGKAGRIHALSAFAPESAARNYAELYRRVLAARRA